MAGALLTAFGPFPGAPVNPTPAIIARAETLAPAGLDVETLVLETRFERVPALLEGAGAPDIVVMTGLALSAERVRIELTARNQVLSGRPDAGGNGFSAGVIEPGAPDRLETTADTGAIAAALAEAGIAFEMSRDAGRYVCEFAYFHALRRFAAARVVFVHLPMSERGLAAPFGDGPDRWRLLPEADAARAVAAILNSQIRPPQSA